MCYTIGAIINELDVLNRPLVSENSECIVQVLDIVIKKIIQVALL